MTTFVIVAAGRGSRLGRVGDELHKCLIPLDGQAIISRQIGLAPEGARIVVVTGYRADQVKDYVRLMHPTVRVEFVHDERWGSGPGVSLLAARRVVEDGVDFYWTACDTLWEPDESLFRDRDASWLAVAPIPAGTPAGRWCRVVPTSDGRYATRIDDKTPDVAPNSVVSTAFGYVCRNDTTTFWSALDQLETRSGEVQFSSGLDAIIASGHPLELRHIRWLDVGDESAYRAALATYGSYDTVKPGQATYVSSTNKRVVKFNADPQKISDRYHRAKLLRGLVPPPIASTMTNFYAYEYVEGESGYQFANRTTTVYATQRIINWWHDNFWVTGEEVDVPPNWYDTVMKFYRDKTFSRVMALPRELQTVALDAVTRIDWDALVEGCVVGNFHGDLTYANVLFTGSGDDYTASVITAIDWREDFAGETTCSDLRYDLGKLLGATVFHWENAAHGDFRRWPSGQRHAALIRQYARRINLDAKQLEIIGALTLLNSAPLHASPMDEILVARGAYWLGQVT